MRDKLNEYREFINHPQKIIGKFPVDIFKRWYDQYNQMYNRESDKLTEIFFFIFNGLKDRHEALVKMQIQ